MNRKKLLLFILLGTLALLLGRMLFQNPDTETPSMAPAAPGAARPQAQKGGKPAPRQGGVRLDLLNREREPFAGTEQDLFGPLFAAKPAPPPPVMPPPPPLPVTPPPPTISAPPQEPPAWAIQQDLARFTYLGFLDKGGEKSVFLGSGDEIFVVKRGGRFGRNQQFQVSQLTPERLVIRQQNDPRPITVPLVEQAPLTAPASGFNQGRSPARSFPPRPGMPAPQPFPAAEEVMPEEVVPQNAAPEEPADEEEEGDSPFVAPGQMGTPGLLQPLRPGPAAPSNTVPPPAPSIDQPAPSGDAMSAEEGS